MAKKRVLVLSASVGAGHLRAAEALTAVGQDHPQLEVVHQDVLELMPRPFQKLYRDAYLDMVNRAPQIFGWLYELTDKPFQSDILRQALEEASAGQFFDFIDKFNPDLALCTHFLPTSLIHSRRKKGRFSHPLATVITDFDVHGMWLATPSDHYFVAVPEARAYLKTFGISGRAVSVTGIPTHPIFAQNLKRNEVAERLGLRADIATLLISTGGFGVGSVSQILESLQELSTPVQIIAACGRNAELQRSLQEQFSSATHIHVIGFTTAFDEYMTCTDLMLGKPGGLTTWESFIKGLAWVVINPIPGQEERNTYHLLELGVGIWAYQWRTLAFKVDQLLQTSGRLQQMQENSRRLARPQAAQEILDICNDLL